MSEKEYYLMTIWHQTMEISVETRIDVKRVSHDMSRHQRTRIKKVIRKEEYLTSFNANNDIITNNTRLSLQIDEQTSSIHLELNSAHSHTVSERM